MDLIISFSRLMAVRTVGDQKAAKRSQATKRLRNPRIEAFRLLLTRGIEVTKYSSGTLRRSQDRVLFLKNDYLFIGRSKRSRDAKRFDLSNAVITVEECEELSNFKLVQKWHSTRGTTDKDMTVELDVCTYFCKEKLVSLLRQLIETYVCDSSALQPHSAVIVVDRNHSSVPVNVVDNPLSFAP